MRGAIFDVDGTLLDSMHVWEGVLRDFFRDNGEQPSDEEILGYYDITLDESIPLMQERLGLSQSFEEIHERLKCMADIAYAATIKAKPGACEYLHRLHERGVKIAIATSGYRELCEKAFVRLGMWNCIDECAFSSEVGVDKSNPDIYLLAAKRIGVPPEECIVYEDILKGIEGAKKGGFATCAIYDATNAQETEALKQRSDRYITGWKELL